MAPLCLQPWLLGAPPSCSSSPGAISLSLLPPATHTPAEWVSSRLSLYAMLAWGGGSGCPDKAQHQIGTAGCRPGRLSSAGSVCVTSGLCRLLALPRGGCSRKWDCDLGVPHTGQKLGAAMKAVAEAKGPKRGLLWVVPASNLGYVSGCTLRTPLPLPHAQLLQYPLYLLRAPRPRPPNTPCWVVDPCWPRPRARWVPAAQLRLRGGSVPALASLLHCRGLPPLPVPGSLWSPHPALFLQQWGRASGPGPSFLLVTGSRLEWEWDPQEGLGEAAEPE